MKKLLSRVFVLVLSLATIIAFAGESLGTYRFPEEGNGCCNATSCSCAANTEEFKQHGAVHEASENFLLQINDILDIIQFAIGLLDCVNPQMAQLFNRKPRAEHSAREMKRTECPNQHEGDNKGINPKT